MISRVLYILQEGIKVMRQNTKLILVGALAFVFPFLLLLFSQSVYSVAEDNIETVQKSRISILHSAIETKFLYDTDSISSFYDTDQSLEEIIMVERTGDRYLQVYPESTALEYVEEREFIFESALLPNETLIFANQGTSGRYWEAVRRIDSPAATTYIITTHNFTDFDSLVQNRLLGTYFIFFFILLLLLALAYWLARQHNWHISYLRLQKSLNERDLFTATIAHEFRTPLTAISGYAGFLSESNRLRPRDVESLSGIQTANKKLLTLVNDFLEVAKLQSGKLRLQFKPQKVQAVVADALVQVGIAAEKKGLVVTDVTNSSEILVTSDRDRLVQVLVNLINNSVKYTEAGDIKISYSINGAEVEIRIQDTGRGISAEDQKKLFEAFSRVGDVEETEIEGSGLGMWITKQLVLQLHGDIQVESIKNVGTAVVVTLPRA